LIGGLPLLEPLLLLEPTGGPSASPSATHNQVPELSHVHLVNVPPDGMLQMRPTSLHDRPAV
jgi:hypothetical protein